MSAEANHIEVAATERFLAPEQGGRRGSVGNAYRHQLVFAVHSLSCRITFSGAQVVSAGEDAVAVIRLPRSLAGRLVHGAAFSLVEGRDVIARGVFSDSK